MEHIEKFKELFDNEEVIDGWGLEKEYIDLREIQRNSAPGQGSYYKLPQDILFVSNNMNNNHQHYQHLNNTSAASINTSSRKFIEEQDRYFQLFDKWSSQEQIEFVENLLRRMSHFQHGHINNYLKPMLHHGFISSLPAKGLLSIAKIMLSYLDAKSLCAAEQVSM